ncbi:hypothetical protein WMY93_011614 [Mugilogobius chulae]|uniref:Calx-beta domain-containing protein n=1 Tax=Mugilogobius chulae TaxID=88201 RepID=A0AAW0P331_9GOBI
MLKHKSFLKCPLPSNPGMFVSILLVLLPGVTHLSQGSASPDDTGHTRGNCSSEDNCSEGVVLPLWNPQNPAVGDKVARAIVYFAALIYMFLGMSIIADRFMSSIEVITSQEKEITIKKPNGETTTTTVRIWNETVSNLTLMALGSSAPEILLSVIEVVGHDFEAGALGPSTIVGSAAFNMFIIIAICVYVVPESETRKIKHLRVFFVTAAWSIFAYIWLYLILSVSSPGEVDVWEAVLTFLFFPLCVLQAWIADRRLLFYKYVNKRYRTDKNRGIIIESEGDAMFTKMDLEMDGQGVNSHTHPKEALDGMLEGVEEGGGMSAEQDQEEEARREMARTLKELKQRHPEKDMEQLIEMANYQVLESGELSRGQWQEEDPNTIYLQFDPSHYQCFENCGSMKLTVSRHGGESGCTVKANYRTEDGTANAGSDYEFAEGTLVFKPGETTKEFTVGVIDDDIFEEDEHFYVRLSNPRIVHRAEVALLEPNSITSSNSMVGISSHIPPKAALGKEHTATVTIYDDDHAGIFTFESDNTRVSERKVAVPYHTIEGTAKAGEDYEEVSGKLEFQNDETMKLLNVKIIDDEEYEKNKTFTIVLEEPICWKLDRGMSTVDKLIKKTNLALVVGSSSWREQFVSAVTVSAGESGEERLPSCFDYIMHFLTVFWKVLFAFVPPTEYWNGWACFFVSISLIGVLTAVTGDLASHFGCTVGLKDSVTAVVFVALGTSVPDTFASKVAAIQDQYADASIGNVTGSNAVNVFLGIGVAWTIAAVYWKTKGKPFKVNPGSLAFSVTLFTIMALASQRFGGELGGPRTAKLLTFLLFLSLWFIYILLASLEAYCHVPGF